jgi:hypothetical protein
MNTRKQLSSKTYKQERINASKQKFCKIDKNKLMRENVVQKLANERELISADNCVKKITNKKD